MPTIYQSFLPYTVKNKMLTEQAKIVKYAWQPFPLACLCTCLLNIPVLILTFMRQSYRIRLLK